MKTGVDLTTGWNSLWSLAPAGLGTAMATVGVAILVIYVVMWAWKKRQGGQGGGMQGFPWMAVLIAAMLAGPSVVFPALLGLISAVINMFIAAVTFFVHLF